MPQPKDLAHQSQPLAADLPPDEWVPRTPAANLFDGPSRPGARTLQRPRAEGSVETFQVYERTLGLPPRACLVFESMHRVRCTTRYPAQWASLSDDDLWMLSRHA